MATKTVEEGHIRPSYVYDGYPVQSVSLSWMPLCCLLQVVKCARSHRRPSIFFYRYRDHALWNIIILQNKVFWMTSDARTD